jgi:hypothetical protein
MNKGSIRVPIATIALGIILLSLGCSPASQNQNQEQPRDQIANVPSAAVDDSCDESNIDRRKEKVEAKIRRLLDEDNELSGDRVKFQVRKVGDRYLEVVIAGKTSGEDELQDLSSLLRKFMRSRCVRRVVIVPSLPTLSTQQTEGFEWIACEHPKILCPDGECRDSCIPLDPGNVGNTPGNSNGNSNLNTNRGNRNN